MSERASRVVGNGIWNESIVLAFVFVVVLFEFMGSFLSLNAPRWNLAVPGGRFG